MALRLAGLIEALDHGCIYKRYTVMLNGNAGGFCECFWTYRRAKAYYELVKHEAMTVQMIDHFKVGHQRTWWSDSAALIEETDNPGVRCEPKRDALGVRFRRCRLWLTVPEPGAWIILAACGLITTVIAWRRRWKLDV